MKTAMQELVETINTIVSLLPDEALGAKNQAIIIKTKAEFLLSKEKEQITEAVMHGLWNNEVVDMANYSGIYYDSTFGDNVEEVGN